MQPKICKLSRYYFRLEHWHKPYCKPNDEMPYIHAKSHHPANILKQLPISIETIHEASKHYQNILNQSGYESPNNESKNRCKSSKNRKRNII